MDKKTSARRFTEEGNYVKLEPVSTIRVTGRNKSTILPVFVSVYFGYNCRHIFPDMHRQPCLADGHESGPIWWIYFCPCRLRRRLIKMILLIIDMQIGLFSLDTPRYDAGSVIARINLLAETVRGKKGTVIFIQHDGPDGQPLAPEAPGWEILPQIQRHQRDRVVRKQACDAFYGTDLMKHLDELDAKSLVITGCATEFCVDTTIRSAASKDYDVIVAADGHTTADRPHLDAGSIIEHHNWIWKNLILPRGKVQVMATRKILESI